MVSWSDIESTKGSAAQYISSDDSPLKGISTGRRFIACATEGVANCGLVQWVDEHWPEHLQNAIHKLWLMYEKSQHNNKMACLEHSCTVHNLT
ncbi:unnamed protein product [Triticum turgidum subsp. durum]|uniref:Uncharacterized protein n=1 Tax=Triticum turgidum subsp. durum TaxID=4567 RepID=A0A9R0WY76_TRITD|nr:unnamed protein product [Triticum turgidum subsp. durum]